MRSFGKVSPKSIQRTPASSVHGTAWPSGSKGGVGLCAERVHTVDRGRKRLTVASHSTKSQR